MSTATRETSRYLNRAKAGRAVLAVLRCCPCTVPELAYILRRRFTEGTIRGAVLTLRRLGLVTWTGKDKPLRDHPPAHVWAQRSAPPPLPNKPR